MNYAGDVSPEDAFAAVGSHPNAVIVDVRTRPELAYVGYPDLSSTGKQLIAVEWQTFPTGQQNPQFIDGLAAHGVAPDHPVYFLCRSGARSRFAAAAATAAGDGAAVDLGGGVGGRLVGAGAGGTSSGWPASELAWWPS